MAPGRSPPLAPTRARTDLDRHPTQNRVGPPGAARTAIPLKTVTRRPAPKPAKSTGEVGTEIPGRDPEPSEAAQSALAGLSSLVAPRRRGLRPILLTRAR